MNERLKFQGKLAERKQAEGRHRVRLDGLVTSLRDLLDPTEKRKESLKGDLIADQAVEFAAVQTDLKEILEEIREIERILGRT